MLTPAFRQGFEDTSIYKEVVVSFEKTTHVRK